VQKHVLDHLRDYVVKDARIEGTTVKYIRYKEETLQSYGMHFRFYVHPDTRVLCLAPTAPRKRRMKNEFDPDRLVLSRDRELRRIDGVWYEIEVAQIPCGKGTDTACFDVLERCAPAGPPFGANAWKNVLWRTNRYARRKRQLGSRELVRYRLRGSS
jgi:hypothetical protein